MTFILSMRSGNSTCMGLIGEVDRHGRSKSKICSICSLYQALRSKGSSLFHNLQHIHSSGHSLRCPHLEIWRGGQQQQITEPMITLPLCTCAQGNYTSTMCIVQDVLYMLNDTILKSQMLAQHLSESISP